MKGEGKKEKKEMRGLDERRRKKGKERNEWT